MKIHEYQAKQFLREYGIPVLDGRIIYKAEEAKTAAGELDGPLWVVKAQIHAGGRGKAGGVELVDTPHGFECFTITVPLPSGKDFEIVRALNMSL